MLKIADQAFMNSNIASYSIKEGTAKIGKAAFKNCKSLTEVTIPEGVLIIEEQAFLGCEKLEHIKLPDSLIEIRDGAFVGTGLKSVYIPSNVAVLSSSALSIESLEKIEVSPNNVHYKSPDGVLYNYDMTEIIKMPPLLKEADNRAKCVVFYEIAKSTVKIGKSAFVLCKDLTEIIIPEGVEVIGDNAFNGCFKLEHIKLPVSLKEIGYRAFTVIGLKNIFIPENVSKIGPDAFAGKYFESIEVSRNNKHFRSYKGVLYNYNMNKVVKVPTALRDVQLIPDKPIRTLTIADWALFEDEVRRIITFPSDVKITINKLALGSFHDVAYSVIRTGYGDKVLYSTYSGVLLNESGDTIILIPKGQTSVKISPKVVNITDHACRSGNVTELDIPENVRIIGRSFNNCRDLRRVTFYGVPDSIAENAFTDCPELKIIEFKDSSIGTCRTFDIDDVNRRPLWVIKELRGY